MSKVAIVTGVTGQDGALLSNFLLDEGYIVVGVARRVSCPNDWRLKELGVLGNEDFILCSGDLGDQGSIERILREYQPQEVYNLAAQSFVGASWNVPVSTFDATGAGAVRVFDAVRNTVPEARVYQASSSEMFGGANRTDTLDEHSIFDPRSPYAVAKTAAHYMARVYRTSFDMFVSCGILFNHESEYRGEEFVTRKVTKRAAEIHMGIEDELHLHNLDSVRDWGYAPDFVEAMWLMLQHDEPDDFVIATGEVYSVADLCEQAFSHVAFKDESVVEDEGDNWRNYVWLNGDRPADVKHLKGDASKAREVLGWSPAVGFGEMVEIMFNKDVERVCRSASLNQAT